MLKGNGKRRKGRTGYFDYKLKLEPKSHFWIQYLKANLGASPASTIDHSLLLHKELFNLKKQVPQDAHFYALMKSASEVCDEIVKYITTTNLTKEQMKEYLENTIFDSFIAKNLTTKEVVRQYELAKRSKALP